MSQDNLPAMYTPPALAKKKAQGLTDEEKQVKTDADKVRFWIGQISKSLKEARAWRNESKLAWREYQNEAWSGVGEYRDLRAWTWQTYARYWADTETMLPAIFSNIPTPVAEKQFDAQDTIARVAAKLYENAAKYAIKADHFKDTFEYAAAEFLNTNRVTVRTCYDLQYIERPKRIPVQQVRGQNQQPIWVSLDNEAIPDDVTVLTGEDGVSYYDSETETEEVRVPKVYTAPLSYDEVLISPGARNPNQIWWVAYKITCTRKEASEKFGAVVDSIKDEDGSKELEGDTSDGDSQVKESKELFSYWQIWNIRDKEVYCLRTDYRTNFLIPKVYDEDGDPEDERDGPFGDPYKLRGFCPSPQFIFSSKRRDSNYPVPDYTQTRELYEQLHILARRINKVTKALKGSAIYDGSNTDLVSFFAETDDNEGIATANMADFREKGGLDALVWFPPYERLAKTLNDLLLAFDKVEQKLDRIRGISDIIRGTSDPETTLGAEQIKNQNAKNRFSRRVKDFAKLIRDTIEIMCDMMFNEELFSDDELKGIVGFAYLDEEEKAAFPAALKLLREDESRLIRINIETDSTVAANEQERAMRAQELLNMVGGYLDKVVPQIQQMPFIAPAAIAILEEQLDAARLGKNVEGPVQQSIQKLLEQVNQPPPPPAPPPPDYEAMKIQSTERVAIEEIKQRYAAKATDERLAVMEAQFAAQAKAAESAAKERVAMMQQQLDKYVADMNAQLKQMQLMLADRAMQGKLSQGDIALQLQAQAQGDKAYIDQTKVQVDAAHKDFEKQARSAQIAQDAQYVELDMQERLMTEQRLQREQELKEFEVVNRPMQEVQTPAVPTPAVNISVGKDTTPANAVGHVIADPLTGAMAIAELPKE